MVLATCQPRAQGSQWRSRPGEEEQLSRLLLCGSHPLAGGCSWEKGMFVSPPPTPW